ncbi:uncharacterized protein [Haliotis asinina]
MRFLLLVVVALTVTDVSGERWWNGVKKGWRTLWEKEKGRILNNGLKLLNSGRSIDDVDQNGDGVLTRSELQQHMDERDVDELMDMLDEDGEEEVKRDVLERYAQEALVNTSH